MAFIELVLKGEASAFSLELPPYRPPRILQRLYSQLLNNFCFLASNNICYLGGNGNLVICKIMIDGVSVANRFISWSNPVAFIFGLNGIILLAYIIAIPANEIGSRSELF